MLREEYKTFDYFGAIITINNYGTKVFQNNLKNKSRNIRYNPDGYPVCSIKTRNGWRSARVPRLVALAFIPNPNNLPEVNHLDYDRKNSKVDNLEWISRADNVRYSVCNKGNLFGENNPNYGNHILHERYKNDKQLAIEKQSRKGLRNGRCRKIHMYKDDTLIKSFEYISKCCEYLNDYFNLSLNENSIRSKIDAAIRNNKTYKGFKFVKE